MASFKVPYLVPKAGRGGIKRYYWQPGKALRALGWPAQRIPDNWQALAGEALEAAAIAKARALNAEVAAWRKGEDPAVAAPALVIRPGTLAAVIASYKLSRFYLPLAESTKRVYGQALAIIEAWGGAKPVRAITPKSIQEFYALIQPKAPGVANSVMRVLSLVMEHARRENLIEINPAVKPGLIGLEKSGLIWPVPAVALLVRHADTLGHHALGTAIVVNEWLGQRRGDMLRMRRSVSVTGTFLARQSKTGAGVKLPIAMLEQVSQRIAAEVARQNAGAGAAVVPIDWAKRRLLVDEVTGAAYNASSFGHHFRAVRAAAAAETPSFEVDYLVAGGDEDADPVVATLDLQFKHLRHTAVVRLAEAGCTAELISAVTGHSLATVNQILEHYLIRTGEMASQAFAKRIAKEQADA